jgi:hypothetical protein
MARQQLTPARDDPPTHPKDDVRVSPQGLMPTAEAA